VNLGQLEDSAFHLYYEWCDEQLRKIESEREQLDREYESGFFNYTLEDSSDD